MVQMQSQFDLTKYNTFGFKSIAEHYVSISALDELPELCVRCKQQQLPLLLFGGGSNLVLAEFLPGITAHMELKGYQVTRQNDAYVDVAVGAGESWHETVERTLAAGYYGLENLALIPGSVGAAPVQNIGAYGVELKDVLLQVEVYDRYLEAFRILTKADCALGYRDSVFKSGHPDRYIITKVHMRLSKRPQLRLEYASLRKACEAATDTGEITPQHVFSVICNMRNEKLPNTDVLGNAGSFFKNPVVGDEHYKQLLAQYPGLVAFSDPQGHKLAAGWLIEQCGWKGKRLGHVGVYEKQALVLVNHGGGNRAEIEQLAQAIRTDVHNRFAVWLEPEPRFYPGQVLSSHTEK
jgi:UDP-N-acetylmuramate dehydrogenase